MSTVHVVVTIDNIEALKVSLAQGDVEIDAQNIDGSTALMIAAWKGHTVCARLLIEHGANVNLQTKSGESALSRAIAQDRRDIVRLLIDGGADLDQRYKGRETPVEYARARGRTEIVQMLEEAARVRRTASCARQQQRLKEISQRMKQRRVTP